MRIGWCGLLSRDADTGHADAYAFFHHRTETDNATNLQPTIPATPPWNRFVFFGQAVKLFVQFKRCGIWQFQAAAMPSDYR